MSPISNGDFSFLGYQLKLKPSSKDVTGSCARWQVHTCISFTVLTTFRQWSQGPYPALSAAPERTGQSLNLFRPNFISNLLSNREKFSIQFFTVSVLSQEPRSAETHFLEDEAVGEAAQ